MLQRWSPGFPQDASPENNLDIFFVAILITINIVTTTTIVSVIVIVTTEGNDFVILHFQPSLSLCGALGDLNLRVNMLKCDLVGHSNHPR